jgi:hypothetical protein
MIQPSKFGYAWYLMGIDVKDEDVKQCFTCSWSPACDRVTYISSPHPIRADFF